MTESTLLQRQDVPPQSRWNDTAVFPSWAEWLAEAEAVKAELARLPAFESTLTREPAELADWLDFYNGLDRRLARLSVYAGMATAVDAADAPAKERRGQQMGLYAQFKARSAFAEPALLELGDTLLAWAKEEPRLAIYEHYFANLLRQKAHRRSAEVEEVLGMVMEPFDQIGQTFADLTALELAFADARDSAGAAHPVQQAIVPPSDIQNPDRELRRTAWESYCDGFLALQNTLASNYITAVKQYVFWARVRGYGSVLEAQLAPYNVPVEVFHNLVDTFKANLPVWHRYWAAKRKVLGVDELHPYDIWAPLVADPPVVPYHAAVDMICEGLTPLGEEYTAVMRRGCLEEGWVDYAPNIGKAQGAASNLSYDTPPFIYTSYNDTLMSMSVLAHELGHSMHSHLIDSTQPHVYNDMNGISMTVAETASNFHQALLRAHLMETRADDPVFQMALIDEAMFNFHRYFFIMPTLARFEYEVCTRAEQDQPLSAGILNEIMAGLYAEGYGATMSDDPRRTGITWAQFGHLYWPYYTFQYAIGISAAHALAEGVGNGRPGAVESYLDFLKAGNSRYALDLFQTAGIDVRETAVVESAFAVLAGLVDRLEELAGD